MRMESAASTNDGWARRVSQGMMLGGWERMKILFCGTECPAARAALAREAPALAVEVCPHEEVRVAARTADVLVPLMSRLDAALLGATSAKLVHQWGTGLEGVDLDAARARGIAVCNVPSDVTPNAESTAEHAVFLMLGVARHVRECAQSFREGRWGAPMGEGLFGARALIVGFGRVGQSLAPRLVALGMQVEAIRRHPDPADVPRFGLTRIGTPEDLATLVPTADFVVSTVPATAESRGQLNATLFRAMKPTAYVINVSRGAVIEERDLVDALERGVIAGAGLDVFADEPLPVDSPLLALPTVFATPHVGGVTRQNYEAVARVVADNVGRVARGEAPRYCVNCGRENADAIAGVTPHGPPDS
jgi:phosphoglycerate dehydrogenase-like enzyme